MAQERLKSGTISCLGNTVLRDVSLLGSGYSGEVKRVQDVNGQYYALKVSNDKVIRFIMSEVQSNNVDRINMLLQEASEFEKLKKLYAAGVPVPRPYAFQIQANADGLGTTAVLMELVKGVTLRDWLSEQPGGKSDRLSGRSIHPASTFADAVARIDVTIAIIGALLKLKRLGFFADFKPRNIMIKEHRMDNEKHYSAYLVDIGGVVLYQDVSTEITRRHDANPEHPVALAFHPVKDRYLIETTCSYLSPEMAVLICEYDFWKGRLNNHFFRTRKEIRESDENVVKEVQETLSSITWRNGKGIPMKTEIKGPELRVLSSYLEVRQVSERSRILILADECRNDRVDQSKFSRSLSQNDKVAISEKSSVFTLGLIMVELFGGRRTGLTSLTRLRHISDIFLGETGNAEFRMVMEWETTNPLLEPPAPRPVLLHAARMRLPSNTSTRCPNSSLTGIHERAPQNYKIDEVKQESFKPEMIGTFSREAQDNRSLEYQRCGQEHVPPLRSYFELYRTSAYPTEGVLAAVSSPTAAFMEEGELASRRKEFKESVSTLLDSCLRFCPDKRPTLVELAAKLHDLRRSLVALETLHPSISGDEWGINHVATPPWAGGRANIGEEKHCTLLWNKT